MMPHHLQEKPQRSFALFVPCLMTGALYRTVPPKNPYMLCRLKEMPITQSFQTVSYIKNSFL